MQPFLIRHYSEIQKLFLSYGLNSVTMDDIATNIHVSKKTIYKEYSCKNELVEEFLNSDFQIFRHKLNLSKKLKSDSINKTIQLYKLILKKVFSINDSVLYDLRKYYPNLLNELVLLYRKSIIDSLVYVLQNGKEENLFHNDICIDSIAKMFSFLFEAHVFNRISGASENINLNWIELLDYHFNSVCTPLGIEKWINSRNKILTFPF